MPKFVRSAKGEVVDFDLLKIRQELNIMSVEAKKNEAVMEKRAAPGKTSYKSKMVERLQQARSTGGKNLKPGPAEAPVSDIEPKDNIKRKINKD